jgi:hypothetical protein
MQEKLKEKEEEVQALAWMFGNNVFNDLVDSDHVTMIII